MWRRWQFLLLVDVSAMEYGVPIGGIVPGGVRVWLLERAVVNLQINFIYLFILQL